MTKFNITKPTEEFKIPSNPEFGATHTPLTLSCDISMDKPVAEEVDIKPQNTISLDIFTSTLHYGQSIFEGLKAYRTTDGKVGIFRGREHMERLARSSEIMCMPKLDIDFLVECLVKYVEVMKEYVPSEADHALYIRPLVFATDPMMKVKSSDTYKFMIMSSVVVDYFANFGDKKIKIYASKRYARAFPGGTGEAKTAANYAQSLPALKFAQSKGYMQVIYLDAIERKYIEELGGMNFFWVENNILHTTALNGQVLHGVTRRTILEIAQGMGMETKETMMTLDELVDKTKQGVISEVFASGTAAIMSPLHEIGVEQEDGSILTLTYDNFSTMHRIKEVLLATQRGDTEYSKKYLTLL